MASDELQRSPCPTRASRASGVAPVALLLTLAGCATIPRGRYGVSSIDVQGANRMDDDALLACLATRERPRFSINLGRTSDPECGVPPFDAGRVNIGLWRWPWTEWPLFDRAVFERDVDRVKRWYRARGFYDAQVLSVQVDPPEALAGGHTTQDADPHPQSGEPQEECEQGCSVDVSITLREGQPVHVGSVEIRGDEALPPELRAALFDSLPLQVAGRFDEAGYDAGLDALRTTLADASYAHVTVAGHVDIDRQQHSAAVSYTVDPGPPCVFGAVEVEQEESVSEGGLCESDRLVEENADTIATAALIERGDPFSSRAIAEAQRAIYALGAFSSVEVEARPSDDRSDTTIPVIVRIVPGRLCRFGLGGGMLAGTRDPINVGQSIPEWDLHLLAFAELRDFLGGLRKLRLEERPRVIFLNDRPLSDWSGPQVGNEVRLELREPSFIEARTTLALQATWDLGPDPYDGFFRHDIDARLGPERSFLDGRLLVALRLRENLFFPLRSGGGIPSSYNVAFLEQLAQLDLRDDPRNPTAGGYLELSLHEAGFFLPASWDYLRLTPEARGYVPLPFGIVLAGRVAVGALFILRADSALDAVSQIRGPQRFRLRGGGATSVRGYLPAQLGDSPEGGIRRWEGSLELRVPVTSDFGFVTFADVGDVNAGSRFRFDWIHLSVGIGLRYRTIVGPVRLDVGWRVPEMQVLGVADASVSSRERFVGAGSTDANLLFARFPGAVHLTIGEAF